MQNGFKVDVADENKLRIVLIVEGTESRPLVVDALKAGPIAASMLTTANASFRKSGKPPGEAPANFPVIQTVAVSTWPCEWPDHETLMFQFGDAALGIAMPKPILKQLGETLLALSATETKPQ